MSKPVPPKFELNDFQRTYFAFLRDRLPTVENDDDLAELILSKGLFALMNDVKDWLPAEKRAMAPKPLPEHYRIILEPAELTALETIYEVQPWWREPVELLHMVIQEGLKAMNRAGASKRDPTESTRSEIEVNREAKAKLSAQARNPVVALLDKLEAGDALSLKFPARLTIELTPEQQRALQVIADLEPHSNDANLVSKVIDRGIESMNGDGAVVPLASNAHTKSARHKETGKDVSLQDRLRKKLTKFLAEHPEAMSKDEARELLVDLGSRRG